MTNKTLSDLACGVHFALDALQEFIVGDGTIANAEENEAKSPHENENFRTQNQDGNKSLPVEGTN